MFDAVIEFRWRLQAGEVLLEPGIYMTDSQASAALADSADFFWFDLEHQAMSIDTLRTHLLTVRHNKTPAIVRVPPLPTGHWCRTCSTPAPTVSWQPRCAPLPRWRASSPNAAIHQSAGAASDR